MKYVALAGLAFAAPAQAEYGWCTIQKDTNYDVYLSDVVDIGTAPDAHQNVLVHQFGEAFQSYVGQFETIVREPDCHSSKRLSDAEESNQRYSRSDGNVIRTKWRGSWPAPGENEAATRSSSGSHLTVEKAVTSVDPAWDQKILAEQHRTAAAEAKAAATALRTQAKAQADLAKMLVEMRERGRAQ